MGPIISPRELAAAIGVSESSLKRWADAGQIRVSKTAGGHRRIAIGEAIRFVREVGAPLVRPELLGLRDLSPVGDMLVSTDAPADRFFRFLMEGKARDARGLILSLYLEGLSVAEIADGPIRAAMKRLGEQWKHEETDIFLEHRATDICVQAVEQLRQFVEPEDPRAIAVGGAPPGDPYYLPSLLVATALQAEGWRGINLGPDTPFDALLVACKHHKPALAWLSVSSVRGGTAIEQGIDRLADQLAELRIALVLGGRGAPELSTRDRPNLHRCQSISDLQKLVSTIESNASVNDDHVGSLPIERS